MLKLLLNIIVAPKIESVLRCLFLSRLESGVCTLQISLSQKKKKDLKNFHNNLDSVITTF